MENSKLYIVSFSDSKKFRCATDNIASVLAPIEKELNDYLKSLFPAETFAYYTSPRVTEVTPEHEEQYNDYPELDANAVNEIKEELKREVTIRQDTRELNSNDPENGVGPRF